MGSDLTSLKHMFAGVNKETKDERKLVPQQHMFG